jgi:hypothetical protein
MTKTFRHKTTNEVATYKDGVLKSSGFSVEIGVEPSSQFWEDITQDYEIQIWSFGRNGEFLTSHPDGTVNYNIHSVKRVSDGKIFTVGQSIKCGLNHAWVKKIISIDLEESSNKIHLIVEGPSDSITYKYYLCDVDTVERLLKSVDGVELFEGDRVYGIYADNWKVFDLRLEKDNGVHKEKWEHGKFSSKEAAQEYILMNKPCLSVQQVKNILSNYLFDGVKERTGAYKDLENLSKSYIRNKKIDDIFNKNDE